MKKQPTQNASNNVAQDAAEADETKNKPKLITIQLNKVTIHYQGIDYSFTRVKGAVEIDADQIDSLHEGLALLLVLLAGARKLYLARDTFLPISEAVWFHLNREVGGLTAEAEELFEDDNDVLSAAALHRAAYTKKPKT